jgi:hypothetical protein
MSITNPVDAVAPTPMSSVARLPSMPKRMRCVAV